MKKYIFLIILFGSPNISSTQTLLETIDGDEITLNPLGIKNSLVFGNLNTSEQSLQFKTIYTLPNKSGVPINRFFTLGIKGKPSDGIFTLFSGGNFNASTNINLSYSQIYLFANRNKETTNFIDFFSIKVEYNNNKLTVLKTDTSFKNQINNFNFEGGGLSFNYNALFSGKNLITFSMGYQQKNNYLKLETIEVQDFKTTHDTSTATTRQYGKSVNGKIGNYKEFESYPIRFGYTYCPSETEKEKDKLKFGFSLYYTNEFGKFSPLHNLGTLIFLTKQNEKSGIRAPIIGLGIQANDLTDNLNKGNKLTKRLSVSLTTTFQIASL